MGRIGPGSFKASIKGLIQPSSYLLTTSVSNPLTHPYMSSKRDPSFETICNI